MHRAHFAHISVGIAGTRVAIGESTAPKMEEMVVLGSMFVGRKREDRLETQKIDHKFVPKALKFNKTQKHPCFGWGPEEPIANSQELYFGEKWIKNHVSDTFLKSPPARNS
jgi:hypothetical protein